MDIFVHILPVVKSVVYAIIVLVVGLLLIKLLTKRLGKIIDERNLDPTLKPFVKSLSSATLKILLIIAIISILGIETTSFVALFGTAGLAIGLAFQGSLSNFAGGVLILITKPFKVGDYVEAGGHAGTVEAIQVLYTNLVTIDNKVIRIPNSNLSNASIVNYSEKATRRVDLKFGAAYEADFSKVIRILSEIAAKHPLILQDPEPFVRMSEHAESAVIYTVRVWVSTEDYWTVYFDFIEQTKQSFDAENISIPYPQVDVHIDKS